MKACTQPDGDSKHVRPAFKAQALRTRYGASGVSAHAVNFAKGVVIGGIIVLFVWQMVG